MIKPVLTEKSLQEAKTGSYTFWVDRGLTKTEIKKLIGSVFDVKVTSVRTSNSKGGFKRNARGQTQRVKAAKKARVVLSKGQKIDLFDEKTK